MCVRVSIYRFKPAVISNNCSHILFHLYYNFMNRSILLLLLLLLCIVVHVRFDCYALWWNNAPQSQTDWKRATKQKSLINPKNCQEWCQEIELEWQSIIIVNRHLTQKYTVFLQIERLFLFPSLSIAESPKTKFWFLVLSFLDVDIYRQWTQWHHIIIHVGW